MLCFTLSYMKTVVDLKVLVAIVAADDMAISNNKADTMFIVLLQFHNKLLSWI